MDYSGFFHYMDFFVDKKHGYLFLGFYCLFNLSSTQHCNFKSIFPCSTTHASAGEGTASVMNDSSGRAQTVIPFAAVAQGSRFHLTLCSTALEVVGLQKQYPSNPHSARLIAVSYSVGIRLFSPFSPCLSFSIIDFHVQKFLLVKPERSLPFILQN